MKLDEIPKFEKLNGLAINIYTTRENGKQVYSLLITKRRDMEPINLLLIEGDEKSHYTWIKNFDRLLAYGQNIKVFCPYCCYGFCKNWNGVENLRKHKILCAPYGAQRTQIPEENFIYFKENTKMLKLPFIIFSDFETLNTKLESCEPNKGEQIKNLT